MGKHKKGGKWKIIPKCERKIHQLFQKGKNVEKNHTVRELSSFSSTIISSILNLLNLLVKIVLNMTYPLVGKKLDVVEWLALQEELGIFIYTVHQVPYNSCGIS